MRDAESQTRDFIDRVNKEYLVSKCVELELVRGCGTSWVRYCHIIFVVRVSSERINHQIPQIRLKTADI